MKKFFLLLPILLLFGCSDSNEFNNSNLVQKNTTFAAWPCGTDYHLEVVSVEKLQLFKRGGCSSGFGFCFGVSVSFHFDCVRDTYPTYDVAYDPSTDEVEYGMLFNETTSEAIVYFPINVLSSPNHSTTDFDNLVIDNQFIVENYFQLEEGAYPINTNREYIL